MSLYCVMHYWVRDQDLRFGQGFAYTMRVTRYSNGITCNAGDAFFFLPVARCVRVCLCGRRAFGHKRFGILTACLGVCIDGVCYIAVDMC